MNQCSSLPYSDAMLTARIAAGRRDLTDAFELVYRSYRGKEYIEPNPGRIVYHAAFGLPTSRTLLAVDRGDRVVGTLTLAGDGPPGLQLDATFPSEVQWLRAKGRSVAEITCLAIEPVCDCRSTTAFFALTRLMIHYAYWQRYDDLLIAIHPKHLQFHRRCFAVQQMGPCRPHGPVRGNPAVCCRIDLHHLRRDGDPRLWHQYFAEGFPESTYRKPPISLADHRYFCRRRGIASVIDTADCSGWVPDAA